ncbi:MAG: hypothetical protein JWQ19_3698 [Subtercola sp.]|nr:hypothetical protein [Subtercola sp.]
MQINKVHVDGQTFILTAAQGVADLKQQILAALQPGAGFVEFTTVGRGLVSILITPHLPVRFETVDRTEEQITAREGYPTTIEDSRNVDIDFFFDHYSA